MRLPDWTPTQEDLGFNYSLATIELLRVFTYRQLAERLGYESPDGITNLISGSIPNHIRGQSLWALYRDTFGHKPPLVFPRVHQSTASRL